MAVFAHEIGDMRACTGKPLELGGIHHELRTTGYGVTSALESAIEVLEELKLLHISKKQNRVSI
jgi:glutamate dehydrogenase (NAD(P)+)